MVLLGTTGMSGNCAAGQVIVQGRCVSCPPGSYSHSGQIYCSLAPIGHFSPTWGSTGYLPCRYSEFLGATYCPDPQSKEQTVAVSIGYYTPISGSDGVYLCASGYAASGSPTSCQICDEVNEVDAKNNEVSKMLCAGLIGLDAAHIVPHPIAVMTSSSISGGISSSVGAGESMNRCQEYHGQYTDSTLASTHDCYIEVCAGSTLLASDCEAPNDEASQGSCAGDQYFRLYDSRGEQVSTSDDACGYCSFLNYTVPGEGCSTYVLKLGCYGHDSCFGHVAVTGGKVLNNSDVLVPLNETDAEQRQVLIELFESAGGRDWFNNANWNTTAPVHTWFGVEVHLDGNVMKIDLAANNLQGSLPSSLSRLSHLQYLYLQVNLLTGSLPQDLGTLTSLQSISLWKNHLSGLIPSAVGDMRLLYLLDLGSNFLHGSLPSDIGYLTKLVLFSTEYNEVSGQIPSDLCKLQLLSYLSFTDNQLTGPLPDFGPCLTLETLYVNYNSLTGSILDTVGDAVSLAYVYFQYNSLTGTIPSQLASITYLNELYMNGNMFTGTIPQEFSFVNDEFIYLNVSDNLLTGSVPPDIALNSLLLLSLSSNYLTGNVKLAQLSRHVRYVYLHSNMFTGPLYLTDLGDDDSPHAIAVLSLANNMMNGTIDSAICDALPELNSMSVANNSFSCYPICVKLDDGDVYSTLPHCKSLTDQALCDFASSLGVSRLLSSNPISYRTHSFDLESEHPTTTGSIVPIELPSTQTYTLSFNSRSLVLGLQYYKLCRDEFCSDVMAVWYNELPGIRSTPVYSFHAGGVLYFQHVPNVDVVSWGFKITVSYAETLYMGWDCVQYSTVVSYSFSESSLSQPHVYAYDGGDMILSTPVLDYAPNFCLWYGVTCEFDEVQGLRLSALRLTGSVPSSLALLTGLKDLVLSFNFLTGTIPDSFASLTSLHSLDMSSNVLHGSVPNFLSSTEFIESLDLSRNHLTGNLPTFLDSLQLLTSLDISSNDLSGVLSNDFCGLVVNRSNDVVVNLGGNRFKCYESCWEEGKIAHTAILHPNLVLCNSNSNELGGGEIAGIAIGCFVFVLLVIAMRFSSLIYLHATYRSLPLHLRVKLGETITEQKLEKHIHTSLILDADDKTVVQLILDRGEKYFIELDLFFRLLEYSLSFETETEESHVYQHLHVWAALIQHNDDRAVETVRRLLVNHVDRVDALAEAFDSTGRRCLDIASPRCKNLINRSRYLFRRYELRPGPPEHKSATSVVRLGVDHGEDPESLVKENGGSSALVESLQFTSYPVALKFMRNRDQYMKEISTRRDCNFDNNYVMDLLTQFDGDSEDDVNQQFRQSAVLKGFEEYPFCVVMDVAEQNLKRIIDQQHIVGEDWDEIKHITKRVTMALDHMHSKGIMHGDIKPMNIMKVGHSLRLIDLDACANIDVGQFAGSKYSSGYLPPELLYVHTVGKAVVRTFVTDPDTGLPLESELETSKLKRLQSRNDLRGATTVMHKKGYELVKASAAQDMWAVGVLLYLLCTGRTLFQNNVDDNLAPADMALLHDWTEDMKESKLSVVDNRLARHLLSQLLNKDPTKRLSAARTLEHPFLSGRVPRRLQGETPGYDVFLSYRVDSDSDNVALLYDQLTSRGMRVWWDKTCLEPGQPWEEGFCSGLVDSACFVCLLSEGAINHPSKSWQNFSQLEEGSRCDNVLLEWRLALELKERGMIEGVFPVFIGKPVPTSDSADTSSSSIVFSNYFSSGCHPQLVEVVVTSVEQKLREHLDRAGLGLPYCSSRSVREVVSEVTANQGGFIAGEQASAWTAVVDSVFKMWIFVKSQRTKPSSKKNLVSEDGKDEVVVIGDESLSLQDVSPTLIASEEDCAKVEEELRAVVSRAEELRKIIEIWRGREECKIKG